MRYVHNVNDFAADVSKGQRALEELLKQRGVDVLLVTSQDTFLSEYNPLCNSQRYALSGFTGSTGDGFFLTERGRTRTVARAPFVLFVDGRYHLQADLETKPDYVEVVKVSPAEKNVDVLLAWLETKDVAGLRVAVDAMRIGYRRVCELKQMAGRKGFVLDLLVADEVSATLSLPGWRIERPIKPVAGNTGRSIEKNIATLHAAIPSGMSPDECCIVTGTSDDAAWLLNARGFHMPRSSALLVWSFLVGKRLVVFLPEAVSGSLVDASIAGRADVEVVRGDVNRLREVLCAKGDVKRIIFNERGVNAWLPEFSLGCWPAATLHSDFTVLVRERARKTPEEQDLMRSAFLKSSRAIARTLRAVKGARSMSEADLAQSISREYAAEGAMELSFSTIAAAGANGAVIHYGACSPDVMMQPGDLVLLDSGAYYDEGFATDCTRVALFPGASAQEWQRKIYTVVLKAFVAGMTARFPAATPGCEVDARVRSVCKEHGFDYGHGTGHGIGIHVHEGGHGISMAATAPLVIEGALSVEPGIYLEGKGGVRIENVVLVKKDEKVADMLHFENLIWVGFDWDLVDLALLSQEEKTWLAEYERSCLRFGTQVTDCPLR